MANILFVDDQPDSALPVRVFLEKAGHAVTCVLNGREALSSVLVDKPDVVLLDLAMPEMDGPSFLEVVRSYLRLQSLPVVVLTGLEESPMVARAQALKVNSVLVKSKATPDDILKAIEEAIVRMPG
jgi:CheY-like chemotaxis protein